MGNNLLGVPHMPILKARILPVLILVISLTVAPSLFAQAISGDLVGSVLDASGAAIPNATVAVTNVATGVVFNATSNMSGDFRVPNLPPGTYTITGSASGFTSATLKGVEVALNRATTANLKLTIGPVSTSVDVSEAGALLDTTTAQVQQTYASQQLVALPMTTNGQGVLNLSLLQSGVASSGGVG